MTNTGVPELFRPNAHLALLQPAAIQQQQQQQQLAGGQQVAAAGQPPPLLARLQECLTAATPGASTQQQLHAHHQVLELLLASLTTYRPLLVDVKRAYDAALQDATAAATDGAFLQARLSNVPANQAHAVAAAREAAEQQAATMEVELAGKLQQLQQQAQEVEAECAQVEAQLGAMQRTNLLAHREHAQLEAAAARAQAELVEGSSWCAMLRSC